MTTTHIEPDSNATSEFVFDVDALIAQHLREAVAALDGNAPLLAGMAGYHLGWLDATLQPIATGSIDRGKRMRPSIAMLCAAAAGGNATTAAPLAAAIELLHNFTLIHDDIQDESPTRRHRPTVWSLWGRSQAINAGDALFASAHLALYRLRDLVVKSDVILALADAFERMTVDIVAGQVLDLSFETRRDVRPDEYLTMISGKTSAIVEYAAWAGATLGGASNSVADRFAEFGRALGIGFQIQDDLLGVWGTTAQTGKAAADDIRRRKQSLPILLLRDASDATGREELDGLYDSDEVSPSGVTRVIEMLDHHAIRSQVEIRVRGIPRCRGTRAQRRLPGHDQSGVETPQRERGIAGVTLQLNFHSGTILPTVRDP